jgi:hypothetical protein
VAGVLQAQMANLPYSKSTVSTAEAFVCQSLV